MLSRVVLVIAVSISVAQARGDPQKTVLSTQRHCLDCYNRRDETGLAMIEADDFRVVLGDGQVQSKADRLVRLRRCGDHRGARLR